jgi:hypothetical protein
MFANPSAFKTDVLIQSWRKYDELCANGGGAPAAAEPAAAPAAAAPAAAAAVQITEPNADEIGQVIAAVEVEVLLSHSQVRAKITQILPVTFALFKTTEPLAVVLYTNVALMQLPL